MRAVALPAKFLLELAALAAFAYAGAGVGSTATGILAGVGLPLVAAAVWGRWAAPKSPRRLHDPARTLLELGVLGAAALALVASGLAVLGALIAAAALLITWALRADGRPSI